MRCSTADPITPPGANQSGVTALRWFGAVPETVAAVDGAVAEALIPRIRYVIQNYKFRAYGDYSPWPGPNSNTFVQAIPDAVPELRGVLPPTAIGKDYPYTGRWFGLTASGTGLFATLAGISDQRSVGSKASKSTFSARWSVEAVDRRARGCTRN